MIRVSIPLRFHCCTASIRQARDQGSSTRAAAGSAPQGVRPPGHGMDTRINLAVASLGSGPSMTSCVEVLRSPPTSAIGMTMEPSLQCQHQRRRLGHALNAVRHTRTRAKRGDPSIHSVMVPLLHRFNPAGSGSRIEHEGSRRFCTAGRRAARARNGYSDQPRVASLGSGPSMTSCVEVLRQP